jgi:hypothetical protein
MTTTDAFYAETGATLRPRKSATSPACSPPLATVLDRVGDTGVQLAVTEHFGRDATPHDLASVLRRITGDLHRKAAAEAIVVSTETTADPSADF